MSIFETEPDENGRLVVTCQGKVIGICDTEEEVLQLILDDDPAQEIDPNIRTINPFNWSGPQTKLTWDNCPVVERNQKLTEDFYLIKGTEVPLHEVFANLRDEVGFKELTGRFDGLTEEHIRAVLDHAVRMLKLA